MAYFGGIAHAFFWDGTPGSAVDLGLGRARGDNELKDHAMIAIRGAYGLAMVTIPFLLLYGCAATVDEMAGTAGNAAARAAVPPGSR